MSSPVNDILADIRQAIADTQAFAAVTLGADKDSAHWPRAEVMLTSTEAVPADDDPESHWFTLRANVFIHVRATHEGSAISRALDLAQTAQESLLADPYRGQRCRDLPIGRATEIGQTRPEPGFKSPYLAVAFDVRCRFESDGEA